MRADNKNPLRGRRDEHGRQGKRNTMPKDEEYLLIRHSQLGWLACVIAAAAARHAARRTLTENERRLLGRLARRGSAAENVLIAANVRVIRRYARRLVGRGHLKYDDAFQEAATGFIEGIRRFDCATGYRLATYCAYLMRSRIRLAVLNQGRTVRLPVNIHEGAVRAQRETRRIFAEERRAPRPDELAAAARCSTARLERITAAAGMSQLSYDQPLPLGEDKQEVVAAMSDRSTEDDLIDAIDRKRMVEDCEEAIAMLDPIDAAIIRARYRSGLTVRETPPVVAGLTRSGKQVSPARIQQIEVRALQRLRRIMS